MFALILQKKKSGFWSISDFGLLDFDCPRCMPFLVFNEFPKNRFFICCLLANIAILLVSCTKEIKYPKSKNPPPFCSASQTQWPVDNLLNPQSFTSLDDYLHNIISYTDTSTIHTPYLKSSFCCLGTKCYSLYYLFHIISLFHMLHRYMNPFSPWLVFFFFFHLFA